MFFSGTTEVHCDADALTANIRAHLNDSAPAGSLKVQRLLYTRKGEDVEVTLTDRHSFDVFVSQV